METVSNESALLPATPTRVSTVARKSTSSNMFLRETAKETKQEVLSADTAAGFDRQKEAKSMKTTSSSIKLSKGSSLITAESSLVPPLIPIMRVEDCSRQGPAE